MKKGLIVEGGGMRGVFAVGVMDFFMDKNIRFDHVSGVSAGACNACSYLSGQKGRGYSVLTDYIGNPEYCSVRSLIKTGDLFGVDFIYRKIPEELYPIDNEYFTAGGTRFQAVVTNCVTGEAEYPEVRDFFRDMDVVRASSSLPMLARMVVIKGNLYLDGGLTDSIPLRHSQAEGNDKNVVILTRPRDYRKDPNQKLLPMLWLKYRKYPKLIEAMAQRNRIYNETLDYIRQEEEKGNVFVIAPLGDLGIGRAEMNKPKLRKGYEEGYYVAEGLYRKMMAYLER